MGIHFQLRIGGLRYSKRIISTSRQADLPRAIKNEKNTMADTAIKSSDRRQQCRAKHAPQNINQPRQANNYKEAAKK